MSEATKIQPTVIKQFKAVETPTITSENEIFKQNNIGKIIPKDALENINLSSVPSIIQTAIDQMALSVESKVLANALLLQIQRDVNNLGDAIVEKSYIDGQVSYLTSIINQKSDLGNVANIVDTRLAIVTENLATASQVGALNSRVGNSETNISNLNQTINTKDSARATQINKVQASVNQSLSHYTDAIGLTVNPDGSVSSSKIEELKAENENLNISIEETNQVIINKDNEWNAKSIKLITSPSGAITGYSFQNGSGLKATFEINADNFKIANSYNTYTPFSIIGTSLFFNGKVAFSSVTGTDNLISLETLQNAIQNNVVTIDGGKIYANQALVNNLNALGGIIADTISANEISGKTFIGSIINGARINGSVIKTSYLDLDGQLQVLTNYHISTATYNANPSLYSDAVYISADAEYRIPSISTVRESTISNTTSGTATYYGVISSYNTGNIGNNLKAVKIRPTFNNQVSFELFRSISSDTWSSEGFTYGRKNHFKLSLGDTKLLECKVELLRGGDDTTTVTITGQGFNPIGISITSAYDKNDFNNTYNLDIGIGILALTVDISGGTSYDNEGTGYPGPNNVSITGMLTTGSKLLPFDWTSGRLKFEQIVAPSKPRYGSTSEFTVFSLNQSLYINNMI